ncbi:OmpA family protein [Myroides odoratus]|uniref:OmpA family protein n=1 Tax=Myroides odoratus TaxID=256 RepID=A0A9Q7EA21_MYROD|nr:OmpA family protein [Myroides odoratus]EHQ44252.1 OmpA/MotB domain protein [Myroides odoratus DSM 2801]EKB05853.1 hypothetical protein HMPREF9716_02646 [Myroides odoratus CIP 103059]QQU01533.1 OmpA family protein [Myroides odoratus]WQD56197.1 OmpA family protein [Myroides odoratus]STZ31589.1 Minor outer membrane protein Omp16 [Myroides odoratus]
MKKLLFQILCYNLVITTPFYGYAQLGLEKKAEKQYANYAYVDAIKIYEHITDKGYYNTSILSKLANAYYFNGKLIEANKWFTKLFEWKEFDKDNKDFSAEYYYRYAQTLKAINDYEKSDRMMEMFANIEKSDTRSRLFNANKNYLKVIDSLSDKYELIQLHFNSKYSDYGTAFFEDRLVFTSAREDFNWKGSIDQRTKESYTKLYSVKLNKDGSFGEVLPFYDDLNLQAINESSAVFSNDQNTVYFTKNYSSLKGKKRFNKKTRTSFLKIYKRERLSNGKWGDVEELAINSKYSNTTHPTLSPDGKWLYFVSDRAGGIGQTDIFRVAIYDNGTYGEVENLGGNINTKARETFPYIAKDNTLYFSSDGRPGLGGLDVYKVKLNKEGTFGEVVNLGSPINSSFDDFGFYLDASLTNGFVSSNRPGGIGGDDIYYFKEKTCKEQIYGYVYDAESKEAVSGAYLILYDAFYDVLGTTKTDELGLFKIPDIICHDKYRIKISKANYITSETVYLSDNQEVGKKFVDFYLNKQNILLEPNDDLFKKLDLNPIHFDFDRYDIREDAKIELMKIIAVMKEIPTMKISVRAHTDNRGDKYYNFKLSEKRAKATIDWIIAHGIDSNRIEGVGYGKSFLLNECDKDNECNEKEHEMNRRSEFIIMSI